MLLVSATGRAHETSHTSSRHTVVWFDAIFQPPELLRVDCKWSPRDMCWRMLIDEALLSSNTSPEETPTMPTTKCTTSASAEMTF